MLLPEVTSASPVFSGRLKDFPAYHKRLAEEQYSGIGYITNLVDFYEKVEEGHLKHENDRTKLPL